MHHFLAGLGVSLLELDTGLGQADGLAGRLDELDQLGGLDDRQSSVPKNPSSSVRGHREDAFRLGLRSNCTRPMTSPRLTFGSGA